MSQGQHFPLPAVLLVFWVVIFFPRWYGLTYTKMRELQQLMGRNYERQLFVMHPAPMRRLVELKNRLQSFDPQTTVVVLPTNPLSLPLAGNAAIVRSILYPYQAFRLTEMPKVFDKTFQIATDCPKRETETECWEIRP